MKRLLVSLFFLCSAWPAENQAVVDWIRANAIRLSTPEAGHGFDDMQPLKKIVGDARVVELGEATHGTREFFQLKHRMLEFLASEMGFTIFSIEANMPEAYRLNEYVLTGKGDPKALLKGMYFWTWDTQEVLDMIQWMRQFNASGKGRVEFTGFDMQTPDVAQQIVRDFVLKYDEEYLNTLASANSAAAEGKRRIAGGNSFGVATGTFPLKAAAGKTIRFSGWIRTEDVKSGFAGLWWRVDGAPGTGSLAFDNMQNRGVTGTTDWQHYTIELPVAAEARNINFGALLTGTGSAWFDGFTVEIDGKPYIPPADVDFDFESNGDGFYLGGTGYDVRPDSVAHSGKKGLLMRSTGGPRTTMPQANFAGAKAAATQWSGVVHHLESMRAAYKNRSATDHNIEWSIQNARVVLQCMQMFANQVTRDDSMAANIKWILDHSPKDKMVVWAHNGHVSAGGEQFASMGQALRKMYGDQMVVFGFAFNQGGFRAVEPGKMLREWTVAPAPEDSLDSTLAAAGIPLLALDLRRAPKTGPVADWWSQPHKTRSIGALFSDNVANGYLYPQNSAKDFDALLFVEKTTAARGNSPIGPPPTLDSREFSDKTLGINLALRTGWSMRPSVSFGESETNVPLVLADSKAWPLFYYKPLPVPRNLSADQLRAQYRADCEAKVQPRQTGGMPDYHMLPESYRDLTISGRPSLTCTAAYTQNGQPMVEYFIRTYTDRLVTMFYARMPAAELESFRAKFDELAADLKM